MVCDYDSTKIQIQRTDYIHTNLIEYIACATSAMWQMN